MGGIFEEHNEYNERREDWDGDPTEWWVYLVIVLGIIAFLVIVISIIACCTCCKSAAENKKREQEAKSQRRSREPAAVYTQSAPPPQPQTAGYYYGVPDYSNQPAYQPTYQPYSQGYNYAYSAYNQNNENEESQIMRALSGETVDAGGLIKDDDRGDGKGADIDDIKVATFDDDLGGDGAIVDVAGREKNVNYADDDVRDVKSMVKANRDKNADGVHRENEGGHTDSEEDGIISAEIALRVVQDDNAIEDELNLKSEGEIALLTTETIEGGETELRRRSSQIDERGVVGKMKQ